MLLPLLYSLPTCLTTLLLLVLSLPNVASVSAQTTPPPPPQPARPRPLIEYSRRDCTGDLKICTNISSGDCCVAGMSNERSTSGDTCVNVSGGVQTGQRWVKGDGDDGSLEMGAGVGVGGEREGKMGGECANVVQPDFVSVGGRWFVVNGSMPVEEKERHWGMWGTGVDWEVQVLPEGLREFEVTGMEGVY
ncbi:hypothetical protein BJX66DRAFT_339455 [Aspergillus keveii]|uniref:Uncharacterized protein n=1 Tax=Aspergillus keveii TaxID=714993 RepID=A0ABR4G283_9EURO